MLASGEAAVRPVDVSDDDFAVSLVRVLQDGSRTPERLGLLTGVVRRQLVHAQQRFVLGQAEQGTASVLGALYLLRVGEGQASMITDQGAKALDGAIKFLGSRGDEGRVHALMRMRVSTLDEKAPEKAAMQDHLSNLERWLSETHAGTEGERRGAEARYLMARSMVDASDETLEAAADAIVSWVERGIEIDLAFRQLGRRPSRAEGMEAARSLETGAMMVAALYVRHGDATRALTKIEGTDLRRIVDPRLRRALIVAAEDGDVRGWGLLTAAFGNETMPSDDDESATERLPAEFVEAALWGSALEAYRKQPSNPQAALIVAERLVNFGMAEGAAAVMAGALGTSPSLEFVEDACEVLLRGIAIDAIIGDDETARRTYRLAAPIVNAAMQIDHPPVELSTPLSKLQEIMGLVEMRGGNLGVARPLLTAAARLDPTSRRWLRIATLDRLRGDSEGALEATRLARNTHDVRFDLFQKGLASLAAFEIHRDAGKEPEARKALDEAYSTAIASRKKGGDVATKALTEFLLSRLFDIYGRSVEAKQAYDKALSNAFILSDPDLHDVMVRHVVSRSILRNDPALARATLEQAMDLNVDESARIYAALCLHVLQKKSSTPDDLVTRGLTIGADLDPWLVKLANWGRGKMTDDALIGAARNLEEKTEAEFFTAMARRVAGDKDADTVLRRIANTPVLNFAAGIARDLLAPPFRSPPLPTANAISP